MTGQAPSADDIERMARAAMDALPAMFRAELGDVVLRVEDYADDETLAALGIEHPLDLSGLYHGRPVGEKSSMDSGALPDMITLYRRAILEEWIETGVDLQALVTHVLVHEVGHHFGLSDDDMHRLEQEA
ncbi:MAG: metallopeptidase family protein [Sphingomonas sp.]